MLKKGGYFYTATYGENGLHDFINQSIHEMNSNHTVESNKRFTLQNGSEWLGKYFNNIQVKERKNELIITSIPDLVDFILTMPSMMGVELDREELGLFLERKKDGNGTLTIPNPFGTFIAMK